MSAAVARIAEPAGDDEPQNDNGPVEIAPGLIAGIRRERLETAARVLARRFVDRAMREMEAATRGND